MTSLSAGLTVMIIKPDLTERCLTERLYKEIKESGLSMVFTGVVHFDLEMIRRFFRTLDWNKFQYSMPELII